MKPTIILYGAGPGFGLPEVSPYVTKTEVQLMMAGLHYRKERATPETSPKGQLPYIDDAGERVADSTFIRAHIERKYRFDYDAGLDVRQRAEAWTIERMLENHYGWTCTYWRWLVPENFAKGPAHFFDQAPAAVRDELRADVQTRVAASMRAVGVARHSHDEIVALGMRSLAALSLKLADNPYIMGRTLCGLDATAFAMLAATFTPYFDSPLRQQAESFGNLLAYTDRMMEAFYPEHGWALAA